MIVEPMPPVSMPETTNVLGTQVSRTTYQETTQLVIHHAQQGQPFTVAPTPVHGIMTAHLDPQGHGRRLNQLSLVVPDGQPVRWALNILRHPRHPPLKERVYGPTLMLHLCQRAADAKIPIFLYGSTEHTLKHLQQNLRQRFPHLAIAGAIAPPFRPLTEAEIQSHLDIIQKSGAAIVFVGLGCPKQEAWAFDHGVRVGCPVICVGAAFDFHAGSLVQAPHWMQKRGLEWLFRLGQEPRRLWQRYLVLNPLFVGNLLLQWLRWKKFPPHTAQDQESPSHHG